MPHNLSIANQFSRYPSGRFAGDGDKSGELFRQQMLAPALNEIRSKGGELRVELDGVRLVGSSFFEEAFGGLVREHGFTASFLREHLVILGNTPATRPLVDDIWSFIEDAEERAVH